MAFETDRRIKNLAYARCCVCLFGIGLDLRKNLWVLSCHIVKLLDILTKIIKLKGCIFVGLNRLPVVDADGHASLAFPIEIAMLLLLQKELQD